MKPSTPRVADLTPAELWDAEKKLWADAWASNAELRALVGRFATWLSETPKVRAEAAALYKRLKETDGMQAWGAYIATNPPSGRVIAHLLITAEQANDARRAGRGGLAKAAELEKLKAATLEHYKNDDWAGKPATEVAEHITPKIVLLAKKLADARRGKPLLSALTAQPLKWIRQFREEERAAERR